MPYFADKPYISGVIEKAKALKKKIILPETEDDRVLHAAVSCTRDEVAQIILIGDEEQVLASCKRLKIDPSDIIIVNPATDPNFSKYRDKLVELRAHKGMTEEKATEILRTNYIYYGVMMVKMDDADGMVAGACHATADTLRPSLKILRTAPGVEMVSGFFLMCVPNCKYGEGGVFVFGDCGLNQDPNSEELAIIAKSSADTFRALVGAEPVVAMLSHSTVGSASHPLVDKVVEAVRIAHEKYPDLKLDGEFQLDAAIVPKVAAKKAPDHELAGTANVLIFPNLDAGNIGYKLVQRLAHAEAYGPMLQGLSKPVNDLSRGCSAHDIVGVVALTALQSELKS